MAHSTPAQKSPRAGSKLRLSTIALVSMFAAVLMVTVLTAATGDNIADVGARTNRLLAQRDQQPRRDQSQLAEPDGDRPERLIVRRRRRQQPHPRMARRHQLHQRPTGRHRNRPARFSNHRSATAALPAATSGPADSLCQPGGVAVDSVGNLYVADTSNNRVLEYTPPFSRQSAPASRRTWSSGKAAISRTAACAQTATGLCYPQGLASDSNDNLYVADAGNHRVLEFNQPLATPNADTGAGDATADLVFGQGASGTDFDANACDIVADNVTAVGMCNPLSVAVDGLGKSVRRRRRRPSRARIQSAAGSARSRHRAGDVTADLVFGQGSSGTDFTDNTCYDGVGERSAAKRRRHLRPERYRARQLGRFVRDRRRQQPRARIQSAAGSARPDTGVGDVTADVVFGQGGSFATGICGGTAASGIAPSGFVLCQPDGVTLDGAGDVFVADSPTTASSSTRLRQSIPAGGLIGARTDGFGSQRRQQSDRGGAAVAPGRRYRFQRHTESPLRRRLSQQSRARMGQRRRRSPTTNPPISSSASPTRCR